MMYYCVSSAYAVLFLNGDFDIFSFAINVRKTKATSSIYAVSPGKKKH